MLGLFSLFVFKFWIGRKFLVIVFMLCFYVIIFFVMMVLDEFCEIENNFLFIWFLVNYCDYGIFF